MLSVDYIEVWRAGSVVHKGGWLGGEVFEDCIDVCASVEGGLKLVPDGIEFKWIFRSTGADGSFVVI